MGILTALAGVNGAGKSSVAGSYLRDTGVTYYNPDEAAAKFRAADPLLSQQDANSRAWIDGKIILEKAIRTLQHGQNHLFETTLGGKTITNLLRQAAAIGHRVRVIFVGLESAEKHIERVQARVARGGHDIPEAAIRQRFRDSRRNIIELLPILDELIVFDNSDDTVLGSGPDPVPKRLLYWKQGTIVHIERTLDAKRSWAKPILAAALELAVRGTPPR